MTFSLTTVLVSFMIGANLGFFLGMIFLRLKPSNVASATPEPEVPFMGTQASGLVGKKSHIVPLQKPELKLDPSLFKPPEQLKNF